MTDEPLPPDGQPVDEVASEPAAPLIHEPAPEEIDAARMAAIAQNDRDVAGELRGMSRRGFAGLGAGAVAALAAWKWLGTRPREEGLPWPLRRALAIDESLALAYFSEARLSPLFPPSKITRPARINGGLGLEEHASIAGWRLDFAGHTLTLDDLRAFPRRTMITEFRCIEGWSTVVQWSGARLADVMAKFPPPHGTRYVSMETPGRGYYVGLDIESATHPQTLLAYEMNGAPLRWQHGAPLRLAIPVKYGVKNIKRIGRVSYAAVRPADYWAEQGYDWYAGH